MQFKLTEPSVCKIRSHTLSAAVSEPLTVALTGDWHISPLVSARQTTFLRTNLQKIRPDLIILQGDLLDTPDYLDDPALRARLIEQIKLCTSFAPTVGVLGNHDIIRPAKSKRFRHFSEFEKYVYSGAEQKWREIYAAAGATLLLNSWFEFKSLRLFGFYQDPACWYQDGRWQENYAKFSEVLSALKTAQKLTFRKGKLHWFVAHAPLLSAANHPALKQFAIFSFGHTHGACVPRGLDNLYDRLGYTGGLYSPSGSLLPPRQMRGLSTLEGSQIIVNTGMVLTQQCAPKLTHYANAFKAAEITQIKLVPEP